LKIEKKYDIKDKSGKTNREFFSQFDCTNETKIQILLNKYTLVMKDADIFIPEMPDTAIKIIKKFTEKTQQISGKKPRIYIIASEKDFKTEYGKRDPIMLAQSPFGFYYHILGAWDKEMIYLPEL
jgi:hypothetical protein